MASALVLLAPTPFCRRDTDELSLPIACTERGVFSHDGRGPAYVFVADTSLPSLSKMTSPWKAFSRCTLHDQPFSVLVTVTSLAATIPGPTRSSELYIDNTAAAQILASSSVVTRIIPRL